MTNWKTYEIRYVGKPGDRDFELIMVDGQIEWRDENSKSIFVNKPNNYQAGDYIEIDNDKTRELHWRDGEKGNDLIRKISSVDPSSSSLTSMVIGSTTITREHSLAVARTLDAMVDQSGGSKEYTASIEVQDNQGKPIKFSISSKKAN